MKKINFIVTLNDIKRHWGFFISYLCIVNQNGWRCRLKLDATIKRASAILGDDSSNGENAGGGSVNGDAGGSGVNKPSGGNTQESGGTSQGTGSENGGSGEDNEL